MTAVVAPGLVRVWDRLVSPAEGELSEDHARYVLRLGFTPNDYDRMTVLGEKANDGTLTPEERVELDDYVLAGLQLAKLHSSARVALRRVAGGG